MIAIRSAIESDIETLCSFDLIAREDDERRDFIRREVVSGACFVAVDHGEAIGYAVLNYSFYRNGCIDMLYVHPGAAGQGVGTMLCDALEKLAGARGAKSLTVEVSDNAQEFFQKRGYVGKQRNTVSRNGEWLANTTMQKTLSEAAPGAPS